MPPARPAERRRIDIYFVLYLVALVLLLPDRAPAPTPIDDALSSLRLELQPQNVRLQQTVRRDTLGGVAQIALDSTNLIKYIGNVDDLHVSARIEDVQTGQTITVQSGDAENGMFSVEPRPDSKSILFRWRPSLLTPSDRTFRVTIEGSGAPILPTNQGASSVTTLPPGLRVSGTTQFVLATVVQADRANGATALLPTTTTIPSTSLGDPLGGGQFWLGPSKDKIVLLATKEWLNKIVVGGADPTRDLAGMPTIRTSGAELSDEVELTLDAAERSLVIKGKAPRSGTATVEVTAERRDGQKRTVSFTVAAEPLPAVNLPTEIYPGVEYVFATKLPDIPNVKAMIRDLGAVRVETTGDALRFVPSIQDTQKILTFERYVDNQREGLVSNLRVRSHPAPEIADVKDIGSGLGKRVVVIFWGDRARNRPELVVLEGNAALPKKVYGNMRPVNPNEKPITRWYEEFEVERKDPSKPFAFRIMARDGRGFTSKVWTVD